MAKISSHALWPVINALHGAFNQIQDERGLLVGLSHPHPADLERVALKALRSLVREEDMRIRVEGASSFDQHRPYIDD